MLAGGHENGRPVTPKEITSICRMKGDRNPRLNILRFILSNCTNGVPPASQENCTHIARIQKRIGQVNDLRQETGLQRGARMGLNMIISLSGHRCHVDVCVVDQRFAGERRSTWLASGTFLPRGTSRSRERWIAFVQPCPVPYCNWHIQRFKFCLRRAALRSGWRGHHYVPSTCVVDAAGWHVPWNCL